MIIYGIRYRVNWVGKVILQIQVIVWDDLPPSQNGLIWRDAKANDLQYLTNKE